MGAVWFRFRGELRSRWRAWLGLGVLVGIAGGVVIAAAAGARRTDSAYDRFLESQRAFDVFVIDLACPGNERVGVVPPERCDVADVGQLPAVADAAPISQFQAEVTTAGGESVQPDGAADYSGPGEVALVAGDGRVGEDVNRWKILEGRRPDPDSLDEVVIGVELSDRLDLHPGDELTARLAEPSRAGKAEPGPPMTLRIVGVEVAPFEIKPPSGQYLTNVHATPAFRELAVERGYVRNDGAAVRLHEGAGGIDALRREIEESGLSVGLIFFQADHAESMNGTLRTVAAAMALLSLAAGVAALAVFLPLLVRQSALESADNPILRSFGFTRGTLWSLGMLRAGVVGLAAVGAAAVISVLLSILTPLDVARTVEPDPGFSFSPMFVVVGVAATFVIVLLVAAGAGWRITSATRAPQARPSAVVAVVARAPLPAPAVTGVRFALEGGRAGPVVPVRSTLLGVILGVVALVAALTFSAGLNHLLGTPRLSGWNWDAAYFAGVDRPAQAKRVAETLEATPTVSEYSFGTVLPPFPDQPLVLDGRAVDLVTFDGGPVGPTILDGRAPSAANEVAVGPDTLRELDLGIGDTVVAGGQAGGANQPGPRTSARLTIVGTTVIPAFGGDAESRSRLGRGAVLTLDGLRALNPQAAPDVVWVRMIAGADRASDIRALEEALGAAAAGFNQPSDVLNVGRVDRAPLAFAVLVALIAAATFVHLLVSAVRARRRDLAVLKTLGFVRGQVRGAVAWQATTLVGIALVVGVPLGLIAGRAIWRLFAERLGVLPEPVTPWWGAVLVIVGTLVFANLVATGPAWFAGRTRPATVLRSE